MDDIGKAPPWLAFYPGDWLADKKVQRMSYAAQGVYIRLLSHMWRDSDDGCSIEMDEKTLKGVLGLAGAPYRKIMGEIQWPGSPIFEERDGRYWSKRLAKERLRQLQMQEQRSKAGKASAAARQRALNGKSTDVQHVTVTDTVTDTVDGHGHVKSDNSGIPNNVSGTPMTKALNDSAGLGSTACSAPRKEVYRVVSENEGCIQSDDPRALVGALGALGVNLIKAWALIVQARNKKNPGSYLVRVLTTGKYPPPDDAIQTAKEEMRKYDTV